MTQPVDSTGSGWGSLPAATAWPPEQTVQPAAEPHTPNLVEPPPGTSRTWLIVLLAVLAVIVAAVAGYFIYTYLSTNHDTAYCQAYIAFQDTMPAVTDDLAQAVANSDPAALSSAYADLLTGFESLALAEPPADVAPAIATAASYLASVRDAIDSNALVGYLDMTTDDHVAVFNQATTTVGEFTVEYCT